MQKTQGPPLPPCTMLQDACSAFAFIYLFFCSCRKPTQMPGKMGSLKPPRCSTRSRSKKVLEVLAERNQMVVPVGAWVEPAQPDALEIPAHVSSCPVSGIWGASPCCTLGFSASSLPFHLCTHKCKREHTCICMQFELASWHSVYFICIFISIVF